MSSPVQTHGTNRSSRYRFVLTLPTPVFLTLTLNHKAAKNLDTTLYTMRCRLAVSAPQSPLCSCPLRITPSRPFVRVLTPLTSKYQLLAEAAGGGNPKGVSCTPVCAIGSCELQADPPTPTCLLQDPTADLLKQVLLGLGRVEDRLGRVEDRFGRVEVEQMRLGDEVADRLGQVDDRLGQIEVGQKRAEGRLTELQVAMSTLTELAVRHSAGIPLPEEYQAVLINSMPSLLSHLKYLKKYSCPLAARLWPPTLAQIEDRILTGLAQPVSSGELWFREDAELSL